MSDSELICVRCNRPVRRNRDLFHDVFERMHWLCFHLEFEHEGDPDEPCDDQSCHEWQLEVFRAKLTQLGHDPDKVIADAVQAKWPSS